MVNKRGREGRVQGRGVDDCGRSECILSSCTMQEDYRWGRRAEAHQTPLDSFLWPTC